MSTIGAPACLPSPEDVKDLLLAASTASEIQYRGTEYLYVREALSKMFFSCLQWLHDGLDCCEILIDALQDERLILDCHNRRQAKALFQQDAIKCLSEDLINFPLRYLCLAEKTVTLPTGLVDPIYQVDDHPEIKEAARRARSEFNSSTPSIVASNSLTSSNGSAGSPTKVKGGKCRDAPSPEHDLPDANITLAEMMAFIPHSIKCWDAIDRIVWNGAVSEDLQKMINRYRSMPYGEIDINSVYLMMRGQMRKRTKTEHNYDRWKDWTVGAQQDIVKPHSFDPDSVSVKGFRRPIVFASRPNAIAAPIPFRDLADGVSLWPNGEDALDLTRCVAWCVENPDTKYFYPSDYHKVLARVGGPITPTASHSDAAVLARFRSSMSIAPPKRRGPRSRIQVDDDDAIMNTVANTDSRTVKRKRKDKEPRAKSLSHQDTTRSVKVARKYRSHDEDSDSGTDTDDEAYQGPKRVKKNTAAPRRSARSKKPVSYDLDETQLEDD